MPQPNRLVPPAQEGAPLPPTHMPHHQTSPFPWARLPEKAQCSILRHALLPANSPTLIVGDPKHRAHLDSHAVPLLLAMGSWASYVEAASVLYERVYLSLPVLRTAAMAFLTKPCSLRTRSLVRELRIHVALETDLPLFDEGWPVAPAGAGRSNAMGVNIPTALHEMRLHGRLAGVLYVLSFVERVPAPAASHTGLVAGVERAIPSFYLPLARLQVPGWAPDPSRASPGGSTQIAPGTVTHGVLPGLQVIAPAFLARRAFQSGFLPLLEAGVFGRVELYLEIAAMDGWIRGVCLQTEKLLRWRGAAVVRVLGHDRGSEFARGMWTDPFLGARKME